MTDDRHYLTVLDKSYDKGYEVTQKGKKRLDVETIWWMWM